LAQGEMTHAGLAEGAPRDGAGRHHRRAGRCYLSLEIALRVAACSAFR